MTPTNRRFEDVRVLVADHSAEHRALVCGAMRAAGFTDLVEAETVPVARSVLVNQDIDLMIGDLSLPEGDLCGLLGALRHRVVGNNPFLVAIAMVDGSTVERAMNSGFDDIVLHPVDREKFIDRLNWLMRNRKQFVVTTDYIGPDRRSKPRPDGMQIPQIKVPNPLALRGGGLSRLKMAKLSDIVFATVNEQKVERHIFQLQWLADRLAPHIAGDAPLSADVLTTHLRRLALVARDLNNRVKATIYGHVTAQCMTLARVSGEIAAKPDTIDAHTWSMLMKLMRSIPLSTDPNRAHRTAQTGGAEATTGVSPLLDANPAQMA